MDKKYEILEDECYSDWEGRRLYRIRALKNFNDVRIGDIGGYIEKESNLSQNGNC